MAEQRFAWKRCVCGEVFVARSGERRCLACTEKDAAQTAKPLTGQLPLFDSGNPK